MPSGKVITFVSEETLIRRYEVHAKIMSRHAGVAVHRKPGGGGLRETRMGCAERGGVVVSEDVNTRKAKKKASW